MTAAKIRRIQAKKYLAKQNEKWPVQLTLVPLESWIKMDFPPNLMRVWRSRDFLVQQFSAGQPGDGGQFAVIRLSINRTKIGTTRTFEDGITWTDLQRLKSECGYGDYDAVEVFPAEKDVVNVANMRHLFVFMDRRPLPFVWRA